MYKLNFLLILTISNLINTSAYSYIGPGMSGGIIVATLGIIIAIFAALFGILYFPIKRFLKNKEQKNKTNVQK